MKTSIIIPVWNQVELTMQCLEAIDAFTPEDHEIVIINNGSEDGTAEVALQHGALVVFEGHRQIARARNAGAAMASGSLNTFGTLTQAPVTWSKPAMVNHLLCTSSPRYNIVGWVSFGKDFTNSSLINAISPEVDD